MTLQSLFRAGHQALMKARYGSKLLERGSGRDLYRTRFGDLFWLTTASSVDRAIIDSGVFEESSTTAVKRLVKPGQVVLDVGANIGYYTVLLAKLVGPTGRVIALEPTAHFREVLERNVRANRLTNVEIVPIGLSDHEQTLEIEISDSSASLHSPDSLGTRSREAIELVTLDDFVRDRNLGRVDFIKIDVDGHEPKILKGGARAIDKLHPAMLLEISHMHYLQAGVTAWDFFADVRKMGFRVYHEDGLVEITDKNDFLVKCGNFAFSSNIVLSFAEIHSP